MSKRKTKYTLRPDGKIVLTKVINGKRKFFYGATDEEVEAKRDAYIASLAEPEKQIRTFSAVADAWWETKSDEISPNNYRSYKAHKENAVADLGDLRVTEITPQILIAHLKKMAAQDYAQKTIKNRKTVIRSILNLALADGDIPANPCTDLPIIKGKPAEPREPASDADILRIEATKASDDVYARLMYFMEYTGCRRGEAVALQEKDIDRELGKATINKSVAYREQTPIIKTPKTKAGVREVDLYDNVLEILPKCDDPEAYVFFPDGLPSKGALERGLKKYQKANGLSSTAHQLRHSYASMLHTAKVDVKNAQHLLGHSSIVVTEDVYTQIEAANRAEVRDQVNRFVLERLNQKEKCCQNCGSTYTRASDGHPFKYCPDCGKELVKL